jgi:leucyl-tRNA synthetase
MPSYNHQEIEKKWQHFWDNNNTYKVEIDTSKPKFYVLDMFPYPSGAGLHVGHPLGYIASDIYARFKKMKGFNVLHPMGFDSFGLPAEQYAIQTGQHPAKTTEENISTYISQLKNLGFGYDWSREIRTSSPEYYKWTQWIFMQLFNSWYNKETDKAEDISTLTAKFEQNGTNGVQAACNDDAEEFDSDFWHRLSEERKYQITFQYRLTYLSESVVNFCPALGMVLSNDEVKDGVSERGGHPVFQKKMKQWVMRITAYCDRLLDGLNHIDWSESLKEQQRNWIGRSVGAMVTFKTEFLEKEIEVFTTRVDTIYGVTFMVVAPEHELVPILTTALHRETINDYIAETKKRSELDRVSDVKTVSGAFTGSYCINPVSGERVPVFIADYVLAGYGTGAVMAVPSGDQRDWDFAQKFDLPILPILDGQQNLKEQADNTKEGLYINSELINGLAYEEASQKVIDFLEEHSKGYGKVNYRLRDAVFARQRYWGEPVPVYYKAQSPLHPEGRIVDTAGRLITDAPPLEHEGLPYLVDEADLPIVLPEIDKYLPTETGEPPLGRAEGWNYNGNDFELSTMPGWAGSSWYFYRYMDPKNENEFASKEAVDYWQDVDLYLGGTEHATGHLLYSRFWNKFLYDMGHVPKDEFAKKLVNQGMIQGVIENIYFHKTEKKYISADLAANYFADDLTLMPCNIDFVTDYGSKDSYMTVEGVEQFKQWRAEYATADFEMGADGKFLTISEVGKMSKSKYNVVNPDNIVARYGADTFRMYEMFLGPLTESKPWDTRGIEGTYRFMKKLWRLFFDQNDVWIVNEDEPTRDELKTLHKTIKKVGEDIENLSFNTSVSMFMVCVNELSSQKCHKKAILHELVIILNPYAPHITEELWVLLGNEAGTVTNQIFPVYNAQYLKEDSIEYPIQINGKVRTTMSFSADAAKQTIEEAVLADETVQKWMEGKPAKKVIVVPKRIVNVVI